MLIRETAMSGAAAGMRIFGGRRVEQTSSPAGSFPKKPLTALSLAVSQAISCAADTLTFFSRKPQRAVTELLKSASAWGRVFDPLATTRLRFELGI
jgi:hypothetical protein